jgi:hypothetical protein
MALAAQALSLIMVPDPCLPENPSDSNVIGIPIDIKF